MFNHLSIRQRIMGIGYMTVAFIVIVIITSVVTGKMTSQSSQKYKDGLKELSSLVRAVAVFRENSSDLDRSFQKAALDPSALAKIDETELMTTMSQAQVNLANTQLAKTMITILDSLKKKKVVEAELLAKLKVDEAQAKAFYSTHLRPLRQNLIGLLEESQFYLSKQVSLFESEQASLSVLTSVLMLVELIVGLLIILGLCTKTANQVSRELRRVISQLNHQAQSVSQTAASISVSSRDLADSGVKQAEAIQETAASIEETNAMLSRNADNATAATRLSDESYQVALSGKSVVENMIRSIQEIDQSNQKLMVQIDTLSERLSSVLAAIDQIASKSQVINDIAFQTKLISFNASVEAARAGEHGKGFRVVAEEVGKLAELSATSAKDISEILESNIKQVERLVQETQTSMRSFVTESSEKVQQGIETATECGTALENIVEKVKLTNTMTTDISSATQEQSVGVSEITKAVNQIDEAIRRNTVVFEKAAKTSVELLSESESLGQVVHSLAALVRGGVSQVESTELRTSETVGTVIPILGRRLEKNTQTRRSSDSVPSHDDPGFKKSLGK